MDAKEALARSSIFSGLDRGSLEALARATGIAGSALGGNPWPSAWEAARAVPAPEGAL